MKTLIGKILKVELPDTLTLEVISGFPGADKVVLKLGAQFQFQKDIPASEQTPEALIGRTIQIEVRMTCGFPVYPAYITLLPS